MSSPLPGKPSLSILHGAQIQGVRSFSAQHGDAAGIRRLWFLFGPAAFTVASLGMLWPPGKPEASRPLCSSQTPGCHGSPTVHSTVTFTEAGDSAGGLPTYPTCAHWAEGL